MVDFKKMLWQAEFRDICNELKIFDIESWLNVVLKIVLTKIIRVGLLGNIAIHVMLKESIDESYLSSMLKVISLQTLQRRMQEWKV